MRNILLLFLFTCASFAQTKEKTEINLVLDNWHKAASEAKFESYFGYLAEESIFIGTDATENWNKKQFMDFAKPYFDKGKAWNFTVLERNIYVSKDKKTVWFDELLNTQMKICRGSGILIKVGKEWKIKHYVLSMTVPNDTVNEVVKIKAPLEDALIEKLSQKK
ncbi:nuclear transport factor 2 family protein [Flavobacterium sp. H122]|uniref:nuclear transport factor 2 family protein n=1 Tax=Flavobacterium sp. H122 TaxID=2529860 RepID=UPI0010A9BC94|nr:nuclear transport factor 2 family protein [Flavobacterium sp. H122]